MKKIFLLLILLLSPRAAFSLQCPSGYTLINEHCEMPPICSAGQYDPVQNICIDESTSNPYQCTISSAGSIISTASVYGLIVNNGLIALTYNGVTGNFINLTTGGVSSVTSGEHTLKITINNGYIQLSGTYINITGSTSTKTGISVSLASSTKIDTTLGFFPKPGTRTVDPNSNYPYIYVSEQYGLQMGNIQLVNGFIDPNTRVEGATAQLSYTCNPGDTRDGLTCSSPTTSEPSCGPGTLDTINDVCIASATEALLTEEQAQLLIEKFTLMKSNLETALPAMVGCVLSLIVAAAWKG